MDEMEEEYRTYEIYRKRISDEDALINYRMTWLILLEPALFAAFGWLFSNMQTLASFIIVVSICLIGGLAPILAYISMYAARKQITHTREQYKRVAKVRGYSKIKLSMIGVGTNHQYGHLLEIFVPASIVFLWLIVILSMTNKHWSLILQILGHKIS